MSLHIEQVIIQDTFGCRLAKFNPGSVTLISGPNSIGKSSILRALAKVFEGGLDPSIIRNGTDKSVVSFRLSNGVTVTKTTGRMKPRKGLPDEAPRYKSEVEIVDADGGVIGAPQTYIESLGLATAIDPSAILRLDATTAPGRKALAELLLQIVPIRFEPEEIAAGLARPPLTATDQYGNVVADNRHPLTVELPAITGPLDLDGLKKYAAQVTELRRRTGQTRDDSDGAINRLSKALPEGASKDYAKDLEAAEREKEHIQEAIRARETEIAHGRHSALLEAKQAYDDIMRSAQAELDRQKAAIQEVCDQETAALVKESQPELQRIAGEIAALKEQQLASQRAVTLRQEIETQQAVLHEAARKYEQLSEVLTRLEALRRAKLDSLPVAGLEVSGDTVLVDGVGWQNVNTARKVEVALQLCTLRAGKLPLLLVDDFEHADAETRKMLEEGIVAAGFQLIAATVSDAEELTIEIVDAKAATQ